MWGNCFTETTLGRRTSTRTVSLGTQRVLTAGAPWWRPEHCCGHVLRTDWRSFYLASSMVTSPAGALRLPEVAPRTGSGQVLTRQGHTNSWPTLAIRQSYGTWQLASRSADTPAGQLFPIPLDRPHLVRGPGVGRGGLRGDSAPLRRAGGPASPDGRTPPRCASSQSDTT